MEPMLEHIYFPNILDIKGLEATYLLNDKMLTINLKYQISGFCRSNSPTCRISQCPNMQNNEVGLSLIMIIEALKSDYH